MQVYENIRIYRTKITMHERIQSYVLSIPCLRSFRMLLSSDHLKHIHPRSTFELHCCENARICQLKIIHHSFYKKTQISNVDSLFRRTHCHGESCAVFCICLFVNTNTCNYSCLWDPKSPQNPAKTARELHHQT